MSISSYIDINNNNIYDEDISYLEVVHTPF